ncbi:MAG: Uracil DNA glycosylase superfamily protein [Deltaproteobacteria bacterium ADurb.BinA179]|nr:uracil-DNA glycosylase [Pseudomonadota bacterium]OPZ29412.1 MAG: Uracil DNA glycosylase superfamily protein [Deltaproteobacteria bacterium ADurb.BinA179]HNU75558.1 uracil-DNA glycosylase [Deltaproteobacteria bacterium]HRR20165.1 uracil-DNA glycosylase [Desulfomonilia bacterium]HOD71100.1 uracil-DNA glycosylase [Deltaproteobacteria bacterium]
MNERIVEILREEERWTGRFIIFPRRMVAMPEDTSKKQALEKIRERLENCRCCPLCEEATNIVFGEGNPDAEVMFIGEAPGAMEDKTGRPFVGPAGRLLTDIIEKGMGLKREDVYIANIAKCRPPGNRAPFPEEIRQCIGFLEEQIDVIRPKVIIALGKIAAQTLLDTDASITALRGNFHEYRGIKVMPTFHPSYLLHNQAKKRDVWEDIKKVMQYLDIPLPK